MFVGITQYLGTIEHEDYRIGKIKPFDQTEVKYKTSCKVKLGTFGAFFELSNLLSLSLFFVHNGSKSCIEGWGKGKSW